MSNITIFLQRQGVDGAEELTTPETATLASLLSASKTPVDPEFLVFVDEAEEPIARDRPIASLGIKPGTRIHIGRCRQIEVTVNFQARSEKRRFAPGTKVQKVKAWAVEIFHLARTDAAEHVLQICGSAKRPSGDTPLNLLVDGRTCAVCFDLVPEKRVEG
jgi:hypothetical protein